jgi:hypothetical protein
VRRIKPLKDILKKKYPNDWKKIIKCIDDNIDLYPNDTLEEEIDRCLQQISSVSALDREHIKKIPRSHIHVGGG